MGSITDHATVYAKTAKEGIAALVKQAEHDTGHNGYSGSIACCDGIPQKTMLGQKKFTENAIHRWISKWYSIP